MKKILCAVLCMAMLLSVAILPVGAGNIDVTSDTVEWKDKSCLQINTLNNNAGNAGHKTVFSLGNVKEDSTITFWVKYDKATASVTQSFPFQLVNTYTASSGLGYSNTEIIAKIDSGLYTGSVFEGDSTTYYGLNLSVNGGATANALPDVWHRIDMAVSFTDGEMTAYLDYSKIGSMALANADNGYAALCIPNNGTAKPTKTMYMDNLMITKGTAAPAKGDIASNMNVDTLKANKDNIIFFDNFDTETRKATSEVGYYWNPAGGLSICTTDGVAQQDCAQFRGVQQSNVGDDGTYNIRFVGTVDSLNYKKIGFKIALEGEDTIEDWAQYVYDSIIGSNGIEETVTYSALGTFGAGYIYASIIRGLSATESYTFTVTPMTVDNDNVVTEHAPYTVSCVNGTVTVSAIN